MTKRTYILFLAIVAATPTMPGLTEAQPIQPGTGTGGRGVVIPPICTVGSKRACVSADSCRGIQTCVKNPASAAISWGPCVYSSGTSCPVNSCTTGTCDAGGTCSNRRGDPSKCSNIYPGNPCKTVLCNVNLGCLSQTANEGNSCTGPDPCQNYTCRSGSCAPAAPKFPDNPATDCWTETCTDGLQTRVTDPGRCVDASSCTVDACGADGKCANTNITACSGTTSDNCCPSGCNTSTAGADIDCLAQCGNGTLEGDEQCDDGNTSDADACSSACTPQRCGDGIFQPAAGEQCDDGNDDDADACSNTCASQRCGDGILQIAIGEQCDDGNAVNDDGCTNACTPPTCGDGVLQAGEKCDTQIAAGDGWCPTTCPASTVGCRKNVVAGVACATECLSEEITACSAASDNCCPSGCNTSPADADPDCPAQCGNGVREGSEQCDDGNTIAGDNCTNRCTLPRCGDGVLQIAGGEMCDDGNTVNDDRCTNGCMLPRCGDGVLQIAIGEQCDDGNTVDDDRCTNGCTSR